MTALNNKKMYNFEKKLEQAQDFFDSENEQDLDPAVLEEFHKNEFEIPEKPSFPLGIVYVALLKDLIDVFEITGIGILFSYLFGFYLWVTLFFVV